MNRRSNRGLNPDTLSALADLKNRKATGKSRTLDYEIEQEADIYETVDEETYAAISAKQRKEARDFIASNDNDYNEQYGMEEEFAMEDQMSMFQHNRKRKRTTAPRGKANVEVKHTKRVASSFFNSFKSVPKGGDEEAADGSNGVLDVSMLDKDFERHIGSDRAKRRRKKAIDKRLGDMLFDAPPKKELDLIDQPDPLMPLPPTVQQQDHYAAPPPSLHTAKQEQVVGTVQLVDEKPSVILEDSLDADALVAAADAAVSKATVKNVPKPIARPAKPPMRHFAAPALGVNLPMARDQNGDVLMFWTDAHEVRVNGGQQLYLFGKVPVHDVESNTFASVCVQVNNMERVLYVLPRSNKLDAAGNSTKEPVKLIPDVHAEVKKLLLAGNTTNSNRLGGAMRSSSNVPSQMKAKIAVRSCPFGDTHAPREPTEYLKVKIPFSNICRMQSDTNGSTFSRVFGTTTTASAHLCLKRKLKGPGWIRLKNANTFQGRSSHARYMLSVSNVEDIIVPVELANKEPPPVSALCINVKTVLNNKNGAHEIVMLAGVFVRDVPLSGPIRDGSLEPGGINGTRDFVLVRPPDGMSIPFGFSDRARSVLARGGGVEVVPNEPALLNNFLTKLLKLDPDVIIGHDVMGFGLDVLLSRMNNRKSREWSRLGRLIQRRDLGQVVKNNISSPWFKAEAVAGRLVVDTYAQAKDLLVKEKDYSISALSHNVLAPGAHGTAALLLPPSTDSAVVPKAFEATDLLCRLVSECSAEARASGHLAAHLNVLPLTRQLTAISGSLWSHTLRGQRAERIEYLLCHEFKLIGSKHGAANNKAGNITAKLLLPDKLNRTQREKLQVAYEGEQQRKAPTKVPVEAPADTQNYGYGDGEQTTPARQTPKSTANTGKSKRKSARRKPQYAGGLVLEPKKGFYDRYVLQLDFNSLYPSIIQEFNICFSTLDLGHNKTGQQEENAVHTPASGDRTPADPVAVTRNKMLDLPKSNLLEGVLPRVLRRLVLQRREVKKLLKEERKRTGKETLRARQLDIRQLAIKLTANSLYGCLGFEGSRFFARPLAEMVTMQGRDTLQKTVDLARDTFNAQVIYGDTDSLFVYTGLEDISRVRKLGMELKRDVNRKYKTLEIEIDAIYKKMLLLKKKKYAALKVIDPSNPNKTVREVKGLDLVRHDWCDLSHDACEHFITQIFKGQSSNIDDAVGNILGFLTKLAEQVNNNQHALSKYVITRALTKRPQDYPEAVSLPHVKVAMRLISQEKRRIKPGDYIKYVVCKREGSESSSVAERSFHPDEVVASEGKLVIDTNYYLESQVLPPIMRLCDPIESIEASRVAVSLGLNGKRYERKNDDFEDSNYLALGPQSAAEKFSDCEKLMVDCHKCNVQTEFRGAIFRTAGKGLHSVGLDCVKCHERFPEAMLKNIFTLATREWVKKYYATPLSLNAEDGSKVRKTRNVGLGGNGAFAKRTVTEAWLYRQLRYLQSLVDVEARWREVDGYEQEKMPVAKADEAIYKELNDLVSKMFDANDYRYIDLTLFLQPLGIS